MAWEKCRYCTEKLNGYQAMEHHKRMAHPEAEHTEKVERFTLYLASDRRNLAEWDECQAALAMPLPETVRGLVLNHLSKLKGLRLSPSDNDDPRRSLLQAVSVSEELLALAVAGKDVPPYTGQAAQA